jgi:Family of unknown function (DUF5330)
MFFLLRVAFWLSIVVLLLPADPSTGDKAPRVTALEALSAAQSTVADVSQFCDRNPDVCVTGNAAMHVFGEKVRYGAQLLSSAFGDHTANNGATVDPTRGTLTPADVKPGWHATAKPAGTV